MFLFPVQPDKPSMIRWIVSVLRLSLN